MQQGLDRQTDGGFGRAIYSGIDDGGTTQDLPFAFPFYGLVAVLIEQIGRRAQHGQWRAQLVRSIRDELLLALERLLDGDQRTTRQKPRRGQRQ